MNPAPFVKYLFCFAVCHLFFLSPLFSQDEDEDLGSWTPEFGYTQVLSGKDSIFHLRKNNLRGFDLRFISPRFELSTDDTHWTDERKTNPAKFRRARFDADFMYAYQHRDGYLTNAKEYSVGTDFFYAIVRYKRFSLDALVGLRLYLVTSYGYGLVNFKKICYWNYGFSAQLDLGFISPFIDIRRMGYCTFGAEFTLHPVYRKPKRHYKLHKFL